MKMVKETIQVAWPAVTESFFIALAGIVDSYMVSSLGANAVAAIGLTTQPKFMGLSVFIALGVAVSALVARRRGEKKQISANQILYVAVLFALVATILITAICMIFAGQIIHFCGSNEETHDMAVAYYRFIMAGTVFNALTMTINAAQRGVGNTKIAMKTNIVSNVVNMIGNYLLIDGNLGFPRLGIQGAAIATVIGTVVATAMCIVSLFEKQSYISIPYMIKSKVKASMEPLISMINMGYSVLIEQVLMRIGFMSTTMMAAQLGTQVMAAHQVGMNILALTFSFGDGMQVAAVSLIGRSLGEGDAEKAKAYGRICRYVGLAISFALAILYYFGGEGLFLLFFEETDIVAYGVQIMYVMIPIVLFEVSQIIYMGCLRGAGDTAFTAAASTVSVTIIRTVFSFLCGFTLHLGIVGIWFGILADQISRYLFASLRFKKGKWVSIRI